ncbi:hypothetical protein JI739_07480 [Ramlibacter sp. AW1]|uniref:Uncharacterized protein n=1 Tax=Ramlibacter aurantiacus TaxID=2801330 RepID=A0A937D6S9_9BURK|nr:hypothetical protein [Ramlibacter aurantiacus]MBL0420186.1 hypothetical protein [Ramlibacter aurantiacus]
MAPLSGVAIGLRDSVALVAEARSGDDLAERELLAPLPLLAALPRSPGLRLEEEGPDLLEDDFTACS